MGLLTSTAIVSASFLLGVLFTSVLWDGSILYASSPVTEATVEAVENYYLTWWNGAMTVKAFLHIVVFALFMSLVAKFARYTETAYYFSGASLVLLVLNASMYIVITIPSIRVIAKDPLNKLFVQGPGADFFTRLQSYFAKTSGPLGDRARAHAGDSVGVPLMTWDERLEHVSVMCAGNTIAMAFLIGVVLLQISEWYVEETLAKEHIEEARKEAEVAPVTEEKKTQ